MKESGLGDCRDEQRIVVGPMHRGRSGKQTVFAQERESSEKSAEPARVALALALAHWIQRSIDAGEIRDQAQAARRLGITRARVTQLLYLTLLCPRIQDAVLRLETKRDTRRVGERLVRRVSQFDSWALQREAWDSGIGD